LTVAIRLADIVTGLAIASAGHFELRAAVFAGHCRELDLLRAHGAFFGYRIVHNFLTDPQ
jgi:hypothetical protein